VGQENRKIGRSKSHRRTQSERRSFLNAFARKFNLGDRSPRAMGHASLPALPEVEEVQTTQLEENMFGLPTNRKLIIQVCGCALEAIAVRGSRDEKSDGVTLFDSMYIPGISVSSYFARVCDRTPRASFQSFVMAFFRLRMLNAQDNLRITPLNAHRLLLAALMVTAKFFDDIHYNNACYSDFGGITTQELKLLEIEFLRIIDWELGLDLDLYHTCCLELFSRSAHLPNCKCEIDDQNKTLTRNRPPNMEDPPEVFVSVKRPLDLARRRTPVEDAHLGASAEAEV